MNIRELEYFITIAEKGNLTIAAETLYVSQPTLSKYVERLECELGIELFERVNRSMKLTYAGQKYLQYAQRILALKHDLDVEMNLIQKGNAGILRVGFPQMRGNFLVPDLIPAFKEKYPEVDLEIVIDSSQKLDEKLKNGKIDLAFYLKTENNMDLQYRLIKKETLCAIFSPEHSIIKKKSLDTIHFDDLAGETLLLQNRTNRHSQFLYHLLDEHNLSDVKIKDGSNLIVAVTMATHGYGIAFLSDNLIRLFEKHYFPLNYYYVNDIQQLFQFVAAYRKSWQVPDYGEYLISLVNELSK